VPAADNNLTENGGDYSYSEQDGRPIHDFGLIALFLVLDWRLQRHAGFDCLCLLGNRRGPQPICHAMGERRDPICFFNTDRLLTSTMVRQRARFTHQGSALILCFVFP
jgi:hypothetical protein